MTFAPTQLEDALRRVDALPDGDARETARDIATGILAYHRAALARLLELLARETGGSSIVNRIARDDLLQSLLALHDLGPGGETIPAVSPAPALVQITPRAASASSSHLSKCELCTEVIGARHSHLLDVDVRTVVCSCQACAVLFDAAGATRYRRIHPRAERLPQVRIDPSLWASLGVPVGLAFFFRVTQANTVIASYPGAAGAVESPVPPLAWEALVATNPDVATIEPDVEALLVNRLGTEPEHYHVSIDRCYDLAGQVRRNWRGMTGGSELPTTIERFFQSLSTSG